MEPTLQEYVSDFCQILGSQICSVIDTRVFFFAWTTDFITGQIFHRRANLFWDAEQAQGWFNIMFDFSGKFPLTKHMPWLVTTGLAAPLTAWRILFPSLVPYVSIYKVGITQFFVGKGTLREVRTCLRWPKNLTQITSQLLMKSHRKNLATKLETAIYLRPF